MAGPVVQRIISDWSKVKTSRVLTEGSMEAAGREAAEAQVEIWQQRTIAQIDRFGRRLRRNSKAWEKTKKRYLNGKFSKKTRPPWLKWTKYKATNEKQVGRFTGRTILDFKWRNVKVARHGTKVGIRWDMYVAKQKRYGGGPTSAQVVEWLRKMKIDIWGATVAGPYRKKEEAAIRDAVRKRLEFKEGETGTMRVIDLKK